MLCYILSTSLRHCSHMRWSWGCSVTSFFTEKKTKSIKESVGRWDSNTGCQSPHPCALKSTLSSFFLFLFHWEAFGGGGRGSSEILFHRIKLGECGPGGKEWARASGRLPNIIVGPPANPTRSARQSVSLFYGWRHRGSRRLWAWLGPHSSWVRSLKPTVRTVAVRHAFCNIRQ